MANMFLIWAPALMRTLTGINLNLYMYHYLFSQITLLYFIVYDDKCANSRLLESEIITFMPWPKPCDFRLLHTVICDRKWTSDSRSHCDHMSLIGTRVRIGCPWLSVTCLFSQFRAACTSTRTIGIWNPCPISISINNGINSPSPWELIGCQWPLTSPNEDPMS